MGAPSLPAARRLSLRMDGTVVSRRAFSNNCRLQCHVYRVLENFQDNRNSRKHLQSNKSPRTATHHHMSTQAKAHPRGPLSAAQAKQAWCGVCAGPAYAKAFQEPLGGLEQRLLEHTLPKLLLPSSRGPDLEGLLLPGNNSTSIVAVCRPLDAVLSMMHPSTCRPRAYHENRRDET